MEFLIGFLLVTVVQATSVLTPPRRTPLRSVCICEHYFDPVCATNGITYSNKCVLKCVSKFNIRHKLAALGIVSHGACPVETCVCPTVVKPVCGSDGYTYPNECELGCDNKRLERLKLPLISVAYQGKCKRPSNCANVIIPVCGSNGKTYRNICFLQYASELNESQGLPPIYYKSYGACPVESCMCPLIPQPLCGSDGKTYSSKCALDCENSRKWALGQLPVTKIGSGPCPENCTCTQVYLPVCASDGKTYPNACALKCENEKRQSAGLPPWQNLYDGECILCKCSYIYDPYCASDDKTYSNYCLFECENEKRAKQKLSPISTLYRGKCSPCVCNCTNQAQYVCGSDKRTYINYCWMRCTSRCYKSQGYTGVFFVKYGYC